MSVALSKYKNSSQIYGEQLDYFLWVIDDLDKHNYDHDPIHRNAIFESLKKLIFEMQLSFVRKFEYSQGNFDYWALELKHQDIRIIFLMGVFLYCSLKEIKNQRQIFYLSLQIVQSTCNLHFEANFNAFWKKELFSHKLTTPTLINMKVLFKFCVQFAQYLRYS